MKQNIVTYKRNFFLSLSSSHYDRSQPRTKNKIEATIQAAALYNGIESNFLYFHTPIFLSIISILFMGKYTYKCLREDSVSESIWLG